MHARTHARTHVRCPMQAPPPNCAPNRAAPNHTAPNHSTTTHLRKHESGSLGAQHAACTAPAFPGCTECPNRQLRVLGCRIVISRLQGFPRKNEQNRHTTKHAHGLKSCKLHLRRCPLARAVPTTRCVHEAQMLHTPTHKPARGLPFRDLPRCCRADGRACGGARCVGAGAGAACAECGRDAGWSCQRCPP